MISKALSIRDCGGWGAGGRGECCSRSERGQVTVPTVCREAFLQAVALTGAMKAGKSVEKGRREGKGVAGAEGCTGVGQPAGGTSLCPGDSP